MVAWQEPKGALTTYCVSLCGSYGTIPKINKNTRFVFHLSVKPISRSAGRSATAAAAYRAGAEIVDERTGEIHDYTRKGGVEHSEIVTPAGAPAWADDRSKLWNAAELAEKRKDARVAREYEVGIPKELNREQGIELVRDFAHGLSERYGVAVDFNIHKDSAHKWDGTEKGFEGYHAHILTTTRQVTSDGFEGKAEPELSDTKRKSLGMVCGAEEIERVRQSWEVAANRHLEQAGQSQRIDCRSLKAQGLDREPSQHLGPTVTALERRGQRTDAGDANRRIEAAFAQGIEDRRELTTLRPQLIDTQTSIERALRVRQKFQGFTERIETGADSFVQRFETQQRQQAAELARVAAEREAELVRIAAEREAAVEQSQRRKGPSHGR